MEIFLEEKSVDIYLSNLNKSCDSDADDESDTFDKNTYVNKNTYVDKNTTIKKTTEKSDTLYILPFDSYLNTVPFEFPNNDNIYDAFVMI